MDLLLASELIGYIIIEDDDANEQNIQSIPEFGSAEKNEQHVLKIRDGCLKNRRICSEASQHLCNATTWPALRRKCTRSTVPFLLTCLF